MNLIFNKKFLVMSILSPLWIQFGFSAPRASDSSQVIYMDHLSEVNVKKEKELTFDKDLNTLDRLKGRYTESLPKLYPAKNIKKVKKVTQKKVRIKTNKIARR